jgi:hypothetical protein
MDLNPLAIGLGIDDARPAFDLLTMLTEWKDWLTLDGGYDDETGPAPVALVVELARQHNKRFFAAVAEEGMLWDDLNGVFTLSKGLRERIASGASEPFSFEHLDAIWNASFDEVTLTQDATEQMLIRRGLM